MLTLDDFTAVGALLTGHFRLSSALHSDRYLQCARLLMWPERARDAGRALAAKLAPFSPAIGGIVIGHEVARALGVRGLFAERQDGSFALRRGFALSPDEPVAVVEDVFTTGGSTREVCAAVESAGGAVVAVGSIVDRGLPEGAFPVPSFSLLSLDVAAWPEAACPLCARGLAFDVPGSRLAANPRG